MRGLLAVPGGVLTLGSSIDAFAEAASRWLHEQGRRHARRLIARYRLGDQVTAAELCDRTLSKVWLTAHNRGGAPVDPSDGDGVARYVYKALRNRAADEARAAGRRRGQETQWPEDADTQERAQVPAGGAGRLDVEAGVLARWLVDCVRRVLHDQRDLSAPSGRFSVIASMAVTYLQIGPPPDAPSPQTKGTPWTEAGWAALHAVDAGHFFPDEDDVKPNTATQRRRFALRKADALVAAALRECEGASP